MKRLPMFNTRGDFLMEAPPEVITDDFVNGLTVQTVYGAVTRNPNGEPQGQGNPARFPRGRALSEYYAEGLEPLEWVIEEYLPMKAITLVIGDPKVGKTTLFLSWLKAMQTNQSFWCGQPVKSSVCWVFTDEGPHSMAKAIDRMGIPVENQLMEHIVFSISDNESDWDALCEWIGDEVEAAKAEADHATREGYALDRVTPRVILIDTYGAWSEMEDVRDYSKQIAKMRPVKRLRDRTGCAIVLIHHARKPSQGNRDDGTNASLGSQALPGQADHILHMTRHSDIETARMIRFDTRMSDTSGNVSGLVYEDHDYRQMNREDIEGQSQRKEDVSKLERQSVLVCFADEYADHIKLKDAMANKLRGMKDFKFKSVFKELLENGLLEDNGEASNSNKRAYRVTNEGRELMQDTVVSTEAVKEWVETTTVKFPNGEVRTSTRTEDE